MTSLLTRKEVALLLKINVSTVDVMVKERKIPVVRIGRYPRFKESDIEKWLNSRTIKTAI